jgi:dephospho-CoA kinase
MKIIGITGGIGSGKTTICLLFESIGIPVYYADIQAKKIMNSNPALKKKVKDLLGDEAYFAKWKTQS